MLRDSCPLPPHPGLESKLFSFDEFCWWYGSIFQVYPSFPGKFLVSFCTQSREILRNCFFSLLRLFYYWYVAEKRFSLHFLPCSTMKSRCSLPLHFRKYSCQIFFSPNFYVLWIMLYDKGIKISNSLHNRLCILEIFLLWNLNWIEPRINA